MKELNKNWLTEGLIDFEYKKYMLLAYLHDVKGSFNEKKLYPFLSDLLFHYQNLLRLKENKQLLKEHFPKQISSADFEKLEIIYEELVNDDKIMRELEEIVMFALPKLKDQLVEGKEIYEEIEDMLSISPIGLSPLNLDTGYLLFHTNNRSETQVYEYQVTLFQTAEAKYRGIHTHFVENISKTIGNTYESIKLELIKKYKKLPNPATFLVNSKFSYPFEETVMPITKRLLVKKLYSEI